MKTLLRIGTLSVVVVGLLCAVIHYTRAQGQNSSGPPGAIEIVNNYAPNKSSDPPKPMPYNLIASYFNQQTSGATQDIKNGGAWTSVDPPLTIKCPCAAGCMLEIEQSVQVGNYTGSTNRWALSLLLDLVPQFGTASIGGEVLEDGNFALANSAQSFPLTVGSHTVQTYIFVDYSGNNSSYAAYTANYHIAYRVYAKGQALLF
jgi:hypothetical protein